MAQNFLVGIPGIGSPTGDFDGYINAIYAMFISIAALLAVVKIVIAGVKYMFSDIVTQKSEAKKDIQGAIFGLVLILGAVLILTVINPDLTNFNLEQNQIPLPAPTSQTGQSTISIDQACTGAACNSVSTAGGDLVTKSFVGNNDMIAIQNFIVGCSNDGGSPSSTGSTGNNILQCFTLSEIESSRISELYIANNSDGDLDRFLIEYQRVVGPNLETDLLGTNLFVAEVGFDASRVTALCNKIGGTSELGLFSSRFVCAK